MAKSSTTPNGARRIIAQFLLAFTLRTSRSASPIARKIVWRIYAFAVQFLGLSHQVVRAEIYGRAMELPAEHSISSVLSQHPNYGRNLALVAAAVSAKYPGAPMIDVGANIGDTAILMRNVADSPILCIEASERYVFLCRLNLNATPGITVVQAFVDVGDSSVGRIVEERGRPGRVVRDASGVRSITLAEAAKEQGFAGAKLVKIDTEGFDGRIIQAALPWIARALPVLFWELDLTADAANSGPGSHIFELLASVGYERFTFYSNFGDYVLTLRAAQTEELQDLSWYFGQRPNRNYVPPYFADVCAFSARDADVHQSVREKERRLNSWSKGGER
jgi:FkbM family methyltransferase